jgi:hypothetical protein
MKDTFQHTENMTPNEKFDAIHNLKLKLEENFVALGQLLSEIKRSKLFRFKGYENFKEFVEAEYNLNSTLAGKLVTVFNLYVEDMDLDDTAVKEIGFDRLTMVRPFVEKAAWEVRDEWMQKAENMPVGELKEHIKEIKNKEKNLDKDLKDVLIEQYLEKMRTWFNCSQKELNFKLALYFQDADLEEIRKTIKERQRQFETEIQTSKTAEQE